MSKQDDRSEAALRERLKIAEAAAKAHAGEWVTDIRPNLRMAAVCAGNGEPLCMMTDDEDVVTATHIALHDPGTTQKDIEEILRLRAENERLALENQRLSVDGVNGEAYLLTCLDIVRKAVDLPPGSDWQAVAERVELMSKESLRIMDVATWLASAMEYEHELCPRDCDVPPSKIECNQDTDVNGESSCDATKCWLRVALNCTGMYQDHDDYTDSLIELYRSILRKGASESVQEQEATL